MSENTANLQLPFILAAQGQKHVTHNTALNKLDATVQLAVESQTRNRPPASPAEGERHIVNYTSNSLNTEWRNKLGQIAAWQDGKWIFYPPQTGWTAYVRDEKSHLVFDGEFWVPPPVRSDYFDLQSTFHKKTIRSFRSNSGLNTNAVIAANSLVLSLAIYVGDELKNTNDFNLGTQQDGRLFGSRIRAARHTLHYSTALPRYFARETPVLLTPTSGVIRSGRVETVIVQMVPRKHPFWR